MCTTSFKIKKSFVLPTKCVYMFRVILGMNSDYFSEHEDYSLL
jgi:hypothetical protein